MREEDVIFMNDPSFSLPGSPSSSDLSDFPSSFPLLNCTSHETVSIETKVESSPALLSNISSMAPQDCSSTSERASSSLSPLNFPSQTEYLSSTSCQDSSSLSQFRCSPIRFEDHSSITEYTDISKSQAERSSSLLLNGTTTLQSFNHSSSPMNGSSPPQPASFTPSKSSLKCSCQAEYSSTTCQNLTSVTQMTYTLQATKPISEHGQSECSFMPKMNGASTSRTINYTKSHLDSSSCYMTPATEDLSYYLPMLSVHGHSSTSALTCQVDNQDAKTIMEGQSNPPSENCCADDFPCVCTCELPNGFPPPMSSSHFTCYPPCGTMANNVVSSRVDCSSQNHSEIPSPCRTPQKTQSPNYLDLSSNILNAIAPPQMNATTLSSKCNNPNFANLTPWSTKSCQSLTSTETYLMHTSVETSVNHLLGGGHCRELSTQSNYSPNLIDSSVNSEVLNSSTYSDTPPAQDFTCSTSPENTLFTNTHEKHLKMPQSCSHKFSSGATSKFDPISEGESPVQECEVCKASLENKVRMDQDRLLCEQFLDSLSRFEDWLQTAQITASQGNSFKTLHREAKLALRKYEVLHKEMREKLLDLESLNRQYWKLTQTPQQMLLPSVLRSRMQEVNTLWDSLEGEAETIHRTLKSRVQQREEFETDQDDMKLCLTEMDLELSNVEYIYGGNSTEKIQQLRAFQEDVWSNMKRVEGLLERGDQLIDDSDPRDAADLEVEMTELGSYCQQIYIRLSRLQKRLVSTKLVFEDDFLDSAIEHLSSGSSDVFLDVDIEGEEHAGPVNGPYTKTALPVELEWDPLGDVGGSSSHDGQESFYTATSAPWKISQRSEGSRSSLSSHSGITYSNVRRYTVKEPLEDLHANHAPPQKTYHFEWTPEKMLGQGQMENTHVLPNALLQLEMDIGQDVISLSDSRPMDEPDSEYRKGGHFDFPKYSWKTTDDGPLTSHGKEINNPSSGQRRRQRKKKRVTRNQDAKRTLKSTKPDVSILMENGDDLSHLDLQKSSSRPSCSLCLWIKRLTLASILLLVLFTSLLVPWGRQSCPSKHFSWSLMLTYVNGPPPI
ncbi:hypothetical protein GDO81_003021 [Engystomops pustulosus]|nr:hypothetical protein GDO81_003021 [Engystomops pustulosus]KAG8552732.1 hypothetical protein GDO81_003021 [Engystomops pustulosus]